MLESPPLQWQSTFEDLSEVDIIDLGDQQGPSSWQIDDGALLQTSNIYGGSTNGSIPDKPGTFALCGDVSWKDVRISVRLSSADNDAIGLMFRVTPLFNLSGEEVGHNFYRFSMDRERGYRRLVKKVGDLTTILWQDNFSYIVDQSYELSIDAVGSELRAYLDGSLLFTVHDDELRDGKIGLYCWANTGARFEQVVVIDRTRQIGRWAIHDEGTNSAPSVWRLNEGVLAQTANIYGGSTLEIDTIKPGTFAVAGNRNWNDYRLAVTLRSDDDDAIGVLFRYTDEDNYYRVSLDAQRNYRRLTKKEDGVVTTLWEDTSGFTVGVSFVLTIDVIGSRLVGYMDSDRLFDIMDASHAYGKVGLYCWGNIGARFEHIKVCIPPLAAFAHISDHFSNDDISDWSFLDEGTSSAPSSWATFDGTLRQTSNIFEQPIDRDTLAKKGTQAIIGDSAWTDVVLSARLQSFDDDSIGILFRYLDESNYYRFSMDSQRGYRRLVKNIDGVFTLLWEDDFSYIVEESYDITISAIGSTLRGYVNSVPIFTVEDSDVSVGKLGLYCWGNNDARFSQIRIYPGELAFNNWLLDETFDLLVTDRWIFEDDGSLQGPSQWDVIDGALLQTSNIQGESLDSEEPDKLGTHAVSGDLAWADYRVTTRLSSDSGDAIGVMFRYKDSNNYYRYSMDRGLSYRRLVKMIGGVVTVLWQDSDQYDQSREYNLTIECVGVHLAGYLDGIQIFIVDDAELTSGRVGLYCSSNISARFAEVRVASSIYSPYYKFGKEQTLPAGTRVRVYSGNQSDGPPREPGMEQRFLSSLEEPGELSFSTEAILLQLRARGETAGSHSRCFLHDDEYSIVDTSVIRKEDGTGVFILNSDANPFAEKPYRFNMIFHRDNRAVESESQVLSQARNSEPEIANIDIPSKV